MKMKLLLFFILSLLGLGSMTAQIKVQGRVSDDTGERIIGATVQLKGTTYGCVTDVDGIFSIQAQLNDTLVISYVGMITQEVAVKPNLEITLLYTSEALDEVVVTGIYTRSKESFTGSSTTYKAKDLKNVGNQNILQSLKTLDPSFVLHENNQYGSDPNRLPDMEIRGKTSIVGFKEQYAEDPNQPLFILDGFETSLQTVMDLSLDRVESVTILKDAASTAIYGAKAANGVIVIETKAPAQGKLSLSYNGGFDINFADLSGYNLMNAEEKLRFELLSGGFSSNNQAFVIENEARYNRLRQNVLKGIDTDWMSEPLRTGLTQRHNLYVHGGDSDMRYGVGVNYTNIEGVMKNSDRELLNGNFDLLYRKGKLSFNNKLTVNYMNKGNPVVPFQSYSRANPYYPKYNEFGGIDRWLETPFTPGEAVGISTGSIVVSNPMWNNSLNSYDRGNSFGVRNNLNLEYRPVAFLLFRGRLGVSKSVANDETFRSPDDTSFNGVELLKKGSYTDRKNEDFSYEGDFTVVYGQLLKEIHQVNMVLGTKLHETQYVSKSFGAIGFPDGNFTTPAFSNSYPEGGKPSYSDSKRRSVNFYFNGGYSLLNRYLLDVNYRFDGTSVFGTNKKFTTTWAVGGAWNLHNENFIKENTDLFSMFKIRASIGNPGNQNFGASNEITTYKFNNWLMNNFGNGLLIDAFGDPDLDWQKTIDKNIGFDLSMHDNRLHVNFDLYHKSTDPLMATIGVPLSVGTSSRIANVGMQVYKGMNGTIKYAFVYKPRERINWTMSLSFNKTDAYYDKIGSSLDVQNAENISKSLSRYYDGGSPTALWAVKSMGIDPASGQEIFLTAGGTKTFSHNYNDEIVVGNTRPTVEGVIGNNLYYKGFSLNIHTRYSVGADIFNYTLYDKVENISKAGLTMNQDRRALYDRWKNPGDKAKYKGISLTDNTPISSRFVQKNNYFTIESVRVGYEFDHVLASKIGATSFTLSAYMNDIYRFTSVREEKGIDYPFARSTSFALSINF